MEVFKKLFELLIKQPWDLTDVEADTIKAVIDEKEILIIRRPSFTNPTIQIFVDESPVYGYGYEFLPVEAHKEINTYFAKVREVFFDHKDLKKKAATDWFKNKFEK